jgi:oxygen-dependent protoporphyrinogen oxidase
LIPTKRDLEPETIWRFAARRIGREAADVLVASMVTGVFGGDARRLSIDHCFPRMAAMEREYGSLFKALLAKRKEKVGASALGPGGTLTTFRRGAGHVAEAAADQLVGRVLLAARARSVVRRDHVYVTDLECGDLVESERLVVALPSYAAARVIAPLDTELSDALAAIPYADIVVVCTAYARADVGHDLNGFGYLVPRTEKRRTLGCLWTSSIFPHEAPAGHVLLRTMIGGAQDPAAVRLSESELLDVVEREVHPLLGITKMPGLVRIYRHAPGIPQYTLAHGERLAAIEGAERRHPWLALAGNAYRGVGLNECVISAIRAVEQVVGAAA